MVTSEAAYPYDRVKLSKALGSKAEELALRPKTFYKDYDIEVMTSTEAVSSIYRWMKEPLLLLRPVHFGTATCNTVYFFMHKSTSMQHWRCKRRRNFFNTQGYVLVACGKFFQRCNS
jgi:hypothetical protein